MKLAPGNPALDRQTAAKILRDLARLPPRARRFDVEAAVWRSVARHMRALTAEQTADLTWQILRRLSGSAKSAA